MALTILLADGVTPNDADHRLVATSLDGLIEAFIVASADHYSDDATFTMPLTANDDGWTGAWQVSFASPWDTWYGAAEAPAACPEFGDVPYPVRFRQHTWGTTGENTCSTAGTDKPCTALTAISDLAASNGNTESVLTWGTVANEDSFVIEYCAKTTDPGSGSWASETGYTSTTAAQNAVTKTITGLTNGTKYWFRIKAVGSGRFSDSAWSNNATATPAAVPTEATLYAGTGDGYVVYHYNSFATVRGAASSGDMGNNTNTSDSVGIWKTGSNYYMYRWLLPVDGTPLPDVANLAWAKVRMKVSGNTGGLAAGQGLSVVPVDFTAFSSKTGAEYSQNHFGGATPTVYGTIAYTDIPAADNWIEIDLNEAGLAAISKTGMFYFGVRSDSDANNSEPTLTADKSFSIYTSNHATEANHPHVLLGYTV